MGASAGNRRPLTIGNNANTGVDQDAEISNAKGLATDGTHLYITDADDEGIIKVNLSAPTDSNASVYSSAKAVRNRGSGVPLKPDVGQFDFLNGAFYLHDTDGKIVKVIADGNREYLRDAAYGRLISYVGTDGSDLFSGMTSHEGLVYKISLSTGDAEKQTAKEEAQVEVFPYNSVYKVTDSSAPAALKSGIWFPYIGTTGSIIRWSNPVFNRWTAKIWSKAP